MSFIFFWLFFFVIVCVVSVSVAPTLRQISGTRKPPRILRHTALSHYLTPAASPSLVVMQREAPPCMSRAGRAVLLAAAVLAASALPDAVSCPPSPPAPAVRLCGRINIVYSEFQNLSSKINPSNYLLNFRRPVHAWWGRTDVKYSCASSYFI